MQNFSPLPMSLEATNVTSADRLQSHFSASFEGLLNRILSLALHLQNTETLSGKANLLCNELAHVLFRRTLFFLVFDEHYQLLASSLFSQNEKDHLAFERHLVDAPAEKKRFYTYLTTLCCESPQNTIAIDNYKLFEQVKSQGIDVHAPIEIHQREISATFSRQMIAHHLFELPTLKDDFGVYLTAQSQHAKVNVVLYLGGGTEKVCSSEAETESLCQTLAFTTRQIATLFENDEAKRNATQDSDAMRIINQLTSELIASSRPIKREKDVRKKLALLCQSVAKPKFFEAAVATVFGADETLGEVSGAGARYADAQVDKALTPLTSIGKLPTQYWQKLAQFGEKISDTFVMLDSVIEDEESPLAFPALCNVFTLLGHRRSEFSVTFFTPFLNQESDVFGFIAYCTDTIPMMVEEWVLSVEALIKVVENDLQLTMFKTSSLLELKKRREFAEQAAAAKLQESLNFSKALSGYATRREKIEATVKAICQKTDSRKVSAFFFNKQGDYALGLECEGQSVVQIPEQDVAKKSVAARLPNRFTLETILSCKGFELNGNFCFTPKQVERVMEGIVTGGSIPIEFLSPDLLKENLQRFRASEEVFLLTPIRYRGEVFGYVAHEPFKVASDSVNLTVQYSESFSLISFFARELGYELSIETLKETSRESVQQIELTRDLTDALFESAKQFQTSVSVEARAHSIAEALTEKFGFQFASIVFYEDGNAISIAAYRTHSQVMNPNLEKRFNLRFQKGMRVPNNVLDAVFRDEFKAGLFYAYRTSDVRKAYRARQSGKKIQENFGASALKDYASGDERAAIMIPLFDDRHERIGHIALGQLMLSNLGIDMLSLSERLKLVSVLVEHLALSMRSYLTAREKDFANENLRRSEARYRNLVENVTYGCIIFDAAGKIQFVNTALKGMLGYTMEAMKDKKLERFAAQKSLGGTKEMYEQIYVRKMQSDAELVLIANSGEEIPFQVSSVPQLIVGKAGELELEGAFAVLIDLRPQYEIEKKKRQLETIKNNFYAMVVHDMKVPLAAIYGYSEMMKDVVPTQMNPNHFQDIMTQIHHSSINITNLIQEILEFSKYESRAVTLDMHLNDLTLCVELVIEQTQFGLNEKEIQVVKQFEPIEKLYFDFTRIARVISNLMSNAIKFSNRQSQIIVSLKKILQNGRAFVRCSVKDFGEGIPANELENIFDAYRQAQSKHGSRGTGLGLSIAKQIVELHGGSIWAESVLGEGATLTFTLPIRTTPDAPKPNFLN
ncbi:MAG: PAS domain-containing sensor histidine kinase [Chloroherpetonaceae bacterium]